MLDWINSIPESLEDEDKGIVVDILADGREWQIEFRATYWIAHSHQPLTLKIGDPVRVIGRCNNTLLIAIV